jgi:anti-sigma factor RsiW
MAKNPPWSTEDRDNLVAYLDGELDEATARTLEARLARDPRARQELEALKRSWELLDYLPRPEPSPQFTSKTMQRLSGAAPVTATALADDDGGIDVELVTHLPRRWPAWLTGMCWTAVVLLAGVGGYQTTKSAMVRRIPAEPVDADALLVKDLQLFENLKQFNHAEDVNFLRALDVSGLFNEDH